MYTVESDLDPVTFSKRKDADVMKDTLKRAVVPIKSDIVRRETTKEGYIPTYGDE